MSPEPQCTPAQGKAGENALGGAELVPAHLARTELLESLRSVSSPLSPLRSCARRGMVKRAYFKIFFTLTLFVNFLYKLVDFYRLILKFQEGIRRCLHCNVST